MSRATSFSPAACLAILTPASIACLTVKGELSSFNSFAPAVLVSIISAPASIYFLCIPYTISGFSILYDSGNSPALKPSC